MHLYGSVFDKLKWKDEYETCYYIKNCNNAVATRLVTRQAKKRKKILLIYQYNLLAVKWYFLDDILLVGSE